jgi:hypothetical protein
VGRSGERAEYRPGQEQLQRHWKTARAMPPEAVVEELSSTGTQERNHVLEIRGGACRRTERGGIERASAHGKEQEASETAADLEPSRMNVLVRQAIAREVEDRPDEQRLEARPADGAQGSARCDVERDNHGLFSLLGGWRTLALACRHARRDELGS